MSIRHAGVVLVLSGPSGAGKSTIVRKVRQVLPELQFSVSCTTRAPRPGEEDGKDYHFLTEPEFLHRLENGEFIEHAQVFAHRYGTLRSEAEGPARQGLDVLLDIDVQGALQIRAAAAKDPAFGRLCEFVFIAPPSIAELERRLRGRGTESEEQIALRLGKARSECSFWKQYGYLIVNEDADRAAEELTALIRSFHLSTGRLFAEEIAE